MIPEEVLCDHNLTAETIPNQDEILMEDNMDIEDHVVLNQIPEAQPMGH